MKVTEAELTSPFPYVVVVVKGGVIQEIVSDKICNVMIVDYDNEMAGDNPSQRFMDFANENIQKVLDFMNGDEKR